MIQFKRISIIICLILSPFISKADEIDHLIRQANDLYSNGEFRNAVTLYDSVIKSGYEAPEVYYNLGNSFYKLGQTTDAIINYERALLLSPEDEDIKYNLSTANNQVLDNIDELPVLFINNWFKSLVRLMPSNNWALISILTFTLFLIFFSIYVFSKRRGIKKFCFWTSILWILLSVNSFIYSGIQKKILIEHAIAIIYSPTVTLKSSPDESGTDLFLLHEGTKVQVTDSLGDWREIRLADGNIAWLKYSDIVIL